MFFYKSFKQMYKYFQIIFKNQNKCNVYGNLFVTVNFNVLTFCTL